MAGGGKRTVASTKKRGLERGKSKERTIVERPVGNPYRLEGKKSWDEWGKGD